MKCVVLLVLCLWHAQLVAQPIPTVTFTEETGSVPVHAQATYFKDENAEVNVQQFLKGEYQDAFKVLEDEPNFGYYKGAIWVRFTVHNPSPEAVTWLRDALADHSLCSSGQRDNA